MKLYNCNVIVKNLESKQLIEHESFFDNMYCDKDIMLSDLYNHFARSEMCKLKEVIITSVDVDEIQLRGRIYELEEYDDYDIYVRDISLAGIIKALDLRGCNVELSIKLIDPNDDHSEFAYTRDNENDEYHKTQNLYSLIPISPTTDNKLFTVRRTTDKSYPTL